MYSEIFTNTKQSVFWVERHDRPLDRYWYDEPENFVISDDVDLDFEDLERQLLGTEEI